MGALRYAGAGALAVAAVVAIAGGGAAGDRPGRRRGRAAERGRRDDRRPDPGVSLAKMPTRPVRARRHAARPSPTASPTGRSAAPRGRPSTPASTPTTTASSATSRRTAASPASTTPNTLPVWLQAAGYHTIHIGKYLNGYGQDASDPAYVPPGLGRVVRGHRAAPPSPSTTTPLNRTARWSTTATGPVGLQAGRVQRPRRRGDQPQRPRRPVLPRGRCTRRRTPAARTRTRTPRPTAPRRPSRRRATRAPSTPSRCRSRRASTRPTSPTSRRRSATRPRSPPADAATIQRRYRCRLESLLSVDDGVGRMLDALAAAGELDETAGRVHLRQRLLPRRAPGPDRQEPRLRGGDEGAAGDPRPRRSRGGHGRRPRGQRRSRPDRPRRRRSERGAGRGRPLAAAVRGPPGPPPRARAALREGQRARRRRRSDPAERHLRRRAHEPLRLRREPDR